MNHAVSRRAVTSAAAALAMAPWTVLRAQPRPELDGYWLGRISRAGTDSTMALKFATDADGTIRAWLSISAMHVLDFPISSPKWDGKVLRFSASALEFDPVAQTLTGVVPERLAPVYKLPVVYRKVERFALPPRPPLDVPERAAAWTVNLGAQVWSDLSAADGVFFVGTDAGVLHALDARDGRERWRVVFGAMLRAAATIDDMRLFVVSDDGVLTCLARATGHVLWSKSIAGARVKRGAPDDPNARFFPRTAAAVVEGDVLYLGTFGGAIVALDVRDGAERWRTEIGDSVVAAPHVALGHVYAGSAAGHVVALDARTGRLRWLFDARGAVTSTPILFGDTVLAGSRAYDLWGLDAASGAVKWNRYVWFSWIESTPAVVQGVAYVGTSDGAKLLALDPASGRPHWEADIRGQSWGTPVVLRDRVLVASRTSKDEPHHTALVLALDRAGGRVLWKHSVSAGTTNAIGALGSGAATANRVAYAMIDGRVMAFDVR